MEHLSGNKNVSLYKRHMCLSTTRTTTVLVVVYDVYYFKIIFYITTIGSLKKINYETPAPIYVIFVQFTVILIRVAHPDYC